MINVDLKHWNAFLLECYCVRHNHKLRENRLFDGGFQISENCQVLLLFVGGEHVVGKNQGSFSFGFNTRNRVKLGVKIRQLSNQGNIGGSKLGRMIVDPSFKSTKDW